MRKSVLIVEDQKPQLEALRRLVLEVDGRVTVYAARDLNTAYATLVEKTVDVFMIDIILEPGKPGDASGVRLAERLRAIPRYLFTPVLFVTSVEDPVKYAYTGLNCLGYVEKPFSREAVKRLVGKALSFPSARGEEQSYCFRKDGVLYPVKVSDILYMESVNRGVCIHMREDDTLSVPYKTCRQLLDEVDTGCLVQCSRNVIVNKDHVRSIDIQNRCITLRHTGEKVFIGVTFKKRVLAEFGNGR